MSVERLAHDGYGMLEMNRVNRNNNEAQCALDVEDFPAGAEVGTIVAVNKALGTLKKTGPVKGLLGNSERLYDQYHKGLKNYKVEKGAMGSVYFLDRGNVYTTNTVSYDTETYSTLSALDSAVKGGTIYGKPNSDGIVELSTTAMNAPLQAAAVTTMPDGQTGIKFIVLDPTKL